MATTNDTNKTNQENRIVPTVPWMYETFQAFNQEYFKGTLGNPKFQLLHNKKYFGYYNPDGTCNRSNRVFNQRGPGIIYLNGYLERDKKSLEGTLLHEMIHMYIYTVLKKCPENQHGEDFTRIANILNAKGWNISEANELVDTDRWINKKGNNGQQRDIFSDDEASNFLFCVIEQPTNNMFKYWGFRAEENNLNAYINTCKMLKNSGATKLYIYQCPYKELNNMPSSPDKLLGIGDNDFDSLINNLSSKIGAKISKENLQLINTIAI
jgi:hypothetical protein